MDDIDQNNKKHLVGKSGRKVREDSKAKVDSKDKEVHFDSRGNALLKSKRKIDRVNKKAFAIQNVAKARKRVSMVVDRQTYKHTLKTKTEVSLKAPHLVAIMGPAGSGKSTLLRTMMRNYTGHRRQIEGPVTVVINKKKRITLLECSSDLGAMIDVAKVADFILLLINVKQGLQTETLELIEILNAHGIPRIRLVYTHIDEYPRHDKKAVAKMKEITKRIREEIELKTFMLTECKKMREARNTEYKMEEVKNLAQFFGQKNPLPNAWRNDHPYLVVDRIERNESLSNDETDNLKFFGFVRGCHMSSKIQKMHLMGVDDVTVQSVTTLDDPCPTPQSEILTKVKRQPLALKERKAYAPMCGYGGVLKDADGFHIFGKSDQLDNDESDDDIKAPAPAKSCFIQDLSDSSDSDEEQDAPPAKKQMLEKELIEDFDELESEMHVDKQHINYERYIYDDDFICDNVITERQSDISNDLFVTGKWGEDEDATSLLKKDDENRRRREKENTSCEREDDEEEEDEEEEEEEEEECDGEDSEEECDMDDDNDDEDEDDDEDDEDDDENAMEVDESDSDDDEEKVDETEDAADMTEGWTPEKLTDFQQKKLERERRTKREKRQEKKDKHRALFEKMYEEKSGGESSTAYFDKWKEANEEQEKKNTEAFSHVDKENVHKFSGIQPGTYVAIDVANIPKGFFARFKANRPVILGGLLPGEESYAILTAKFKIHRHYDQTQVFKLKDPLCISVGWRRIQTFCHFFREDHNLRKTCLKYSTVKGIFCDVAFLAPVVPVKTGYVAFQHFGPSDRFRVAALGSVQSKDDKVDIKKKLKRVGRPISIKKKTAFIGGMFQDALEVEQYNDSLLKTTSGVRGAVKKALNDATNEAGSFRATFEAQISMADLVSLTCWASIKMLTFCQNVADLVDDQFEYWQPWNRFKRERGIALPAPKPDSAYRSITRPEFKPAPITFSKKVIDQLPFENRPQLPKPEDLVQQNRPKVVLDAKESKRVQLFENLMEEDKERRQKHNKQKQVYKVKKGKMVEAANLKKQEKEKDKRKRFFKKAGLKSGNKGSKSKSHEG